MNNNIFKINPEKDMSFISKLTDQVMFDKIECDPGKRGLSDKVTGTLVLASIFIILPLIGLLNNASLLALSWVITIVWCAFVIYGSKWSEKHEKKPVANYVIETSQFADDMIGELGFDDYNVQTKADKTTLNSLDLLIRFGFMAGKRDDVKAVIDKRQDIKTIVMGLKNLDSLSATNSDNYQTIYNHLVNELTALRDEMLQTLMPALNCEIVLAIKNGNTDFMPARIKKALATVYAQKVIDDAED